MSNAFTGRLKQIANAIYSGGFADSQHKLVLPKNTTAKLAQILPVEQASLAYDTTLNEVVFNNGSSFSPISAGSGANTSLNNLTAVAINTGLAFGSGVAGSLTTADNASLSQDLTLSTGNTTAPSGLSGNIILMPGTGPTSSSNSGSISLATQSIAGAGAIAGDILLTAGSAATHSGNIVLRLTNALGAFGKLKIKDGSEGTAGYVWTSVDTAGSGSWMPAASGGANTFLSNLTSPTAINQSLVYGTSASPVPGVLATADNNIVLSTAGTSSLTVKSGSSNSAGAFSVAGDLNLTAGSINPGISFCTGGSVNITSGSSNGVSSGAGNITLTPGTSGNAGTGPRGLIRFKDGSEGTSGYIWTSTDTNGAGTWMVASSGGSAAGPSGAVQFSDGSGVFLADDASFHWDDTVKSLSIGVTPSVSAGILSIDGDNGGNGQLYLTNAAGSGGFTIIGVESNPPATLGGNPGDLSIFSNGAFQMQASGGIFLSGTRTGAVLSVPNTNKSVLVQVPTPHTGVDVPMFAVGDGGFVGGVAPNFVGISTNGTYIGLNAATSPNTPTLMDLQIAGVSAFSVGGLPGANANFARLRTTASHVDALRVDTTAADDTISAGSDYKVVYNIGAGSFNINLPPGEQGLNFILSKASTNTATLTIVPDSGNPDLLDANVQTIFNANRPVSVTYDEGSLTWYAV